MTNSQQNMPRFGLVKSLRTKDEATGLLTKLEQISACLRQTKDRRQLISTTLTITEEQLLLNDLQNQGTDINHQEAASVIAKIISAIKALPITTVELAFLPSAKFAIEVANYINAQKSSLRLIEIQYNPTIGAGLILYHQGRRYDYSISHQLDELKL